ncbi:Receptor-type tyrosine-protein phosphatase zeta, partial [Bulinus truncatus]
CVYYKWGHNCDNNCTANCFNHSCNSTTGICSDGCHGFSDPPYCTKGCHTGYYGRNCSFTCSSTCTMCDSLTGFCSTCIDGYLGNFCEQACGNHTYGQNCTYNCSSFCSVTMDTSKNRCNHVTGVCLYGCVSGYTTSMCSELISSDDPPAGAIVGPIIAVIVVAVLIFVAIILWRRRKAAKRNAAYNGAKSFSQLSNSSQTSDKPLFSNIDNGSQDTSTYTNIEIKLPEDTAIFVSDLPSYLHSHSAEFLKEQYQKIPSPKNVTLDIGLCEENKPKNRFKNVCPYDHSRVHLKINTAKHEGDYINASYIKGFNDEVTFIASQGPNSIVINDFIRMLWEQKVDKVVMLTNLIEEGKVKCDKYWPDETKVKFGDIKLRLISTKTFADYTIRQIEISKKEDASHMFTHFHFTSWPDQGVPSAPWSLVDLEQRVASTSTTNPIVVHCSAGVGRTGTFIGLYNIMRQAEHTGKVDFFKTLTKLREDRMLMIQTAEQYEFLHRAAHVAIVCMGKTISSSEFSDRIKILEDKIFIGQSQVDREFRAVCTAASNCTKEEQQLDDDNNIYQNAEKHERKNRFSGIIPKLVHKPYLARENADMGDYINAVFIPGFQQKDQHFLTQLPLPLTVIDLYRLIVQYKVSLMIVFELDKMDSDKTIGNYLPARYEEPLRCPPFVVHSSLSKQDQLYEEHILNVHSKNEKQDVSHLKCKFADLDAQKWFVLMKKIKSYNIQGNEKIIYMCRNGAEFSGFACTLSLLIDRMDFDSCLTVPLVVGAIKTVRPEVIPTLDQYRTLYHVLEKYVETSTVYTNVGDDFFRKSFSKVKKLTLPEDESENIYNNEDNLNVYSNF